MIKTLKDREALPKPKNDECLIMCRECGTKLLVSDDEIKRAFFDPTAGCIPDQVECPKCKQDTFILYRWEWYTPGSILDRIVRFFIP